MKKRFSLLVLGVSVLALSACGGRPASSSSEPAPSSSEESQTTSEQITSQEETSQELTSQEETSQEESTVEHVHTFSDEWTYDETHHWHAATCEHTELKDAYEEHALEKNADETEETCACGYVHTLVSSLAAPTNLKYEDGIFAFDAVENAKRYEVTAKLGEDVVLNETIEETSLSLYQLAKGTYEVNVVAKAGTLVSDAASLEVNQIYFKDVDQLLEAENFVSNKNHISIDADAHGGAYTLGFDDCGQGLYFSYYAFEAGERDITVRYSTGAVGSYMNMYINEDEDHPIMVLFDENTGWFGDTKESADKTVKATLKEGWNDIYLFKNGTSEDYPEYGGYAQIDYIIVGGTQKIFDSTTHSVPMKEEYRYEAEQARWHWANEYQRPNMSDPWPSHGYLGEENAYGDGVAFDISVPVAGTYLLKFASAAGTEGRYYDVTVNEDKYNVFVKTGPNWNIVAEDDGFLVHLNEGANLIDFSRGSNGNWACIDYLVVKYIGEDDPVLPTAVTGLKFENNVLSFNALEDVNEYLVTLVKDEVVLDSKVIRGTTYEVPTTIVAKEVTATVKAKSGFFVAAEGSSLVINPGFIVDQDVRLEAELATIGEKHYSVDPLASGGAYALGFDNCGEGMYFRYYSYAEGERDITIGYATGAPNSKMELIVNDEELVTVVFTENTGWFGDSHVIATVGAKINLQKGWNEIYMMKNGTSSDNYGGWVQIDYIDVKGTGNLVDVSELTDLVCSRYKLEAEGSNYSIQYAKAPALDSAFSIAYLGEQNEVGNGAYYKFYVDVAGTYKVQFFCGGEGSRKVEMKVNGEAIINNGDSYTLTTGGGWNVVAGDPGFEVELNAGWNTISMSRISNERGGGWICIDYCLVTLVS